MVNFTVVGVALTLRKKCDNMNEWNVYEVIVSLVGFSVAVITPLIKLNSTIAKLSQVVNDFVDSVNKSDARNIEAHERIWKQINVTQNAVTEHDKRISIIEAKNFD